MIDDAIRAAVAEALAPLVAEVAQLRAAVERSTPPKLVSIADAAVALGISACTARRWEASGQLRSVRRGRRVLVDLASVRPRTDGEIARLAREARE